MPEIPISPEQEAYIEALREELNDEVTYGHVRVQDAVQYLIDHHREDGDLDVTIDGEVEADTDERGGGRNGASAGEAAEQAETADGGENTDSGGTSSIEETAAALGNAGPGGGSEDGEDGGAEETPPETDTGDGAGTIGSAGGEMVDEMMNLMDANDDVWEETDSSEGKYRVELPDGDTETVQTKDDVRALLFKHYR